MTERRIDLITVKAEARSVFGDSAEAWLRRSNRFLDSMTPLQVAQSPEGAAIVLRVLQQQAGLLHLSSTKCGSVGVPVAQPARERTGMNAKRRSAGALGGA